MRMCESPASTTNVFVPLLVGTLRACEPEPTLRQADNTNFLHTQDSGSLGSYPVNSVQPCHGNVAKERQQVGSTRQWHDGGRFCTRRRLPPCAPAMGRSEWLNSLIIAIPGQKQIGALPLFCFRAPVDQPDKVTMTRTSLPRTRV